MVQHPSVADVSKALWSFASPSQVFLDTFPELAGLRVGDLALRFADGIVLGLLNRRTGKCQVVPPASTTVSAPAPLMALSSPAWHMPTCHWPLGRCLLHCVPHQAAGQPSAVSCRMGQARSQ